MTEVCTGAEKFPLPEGLTRHRMDDYFEHVDEAIAMAVMYTANHLHVTAIIALTESGSTARWMSRIRSDIPIYALTPYTTTSRRVTMYRGVYPVPFRDRASRRRPVPRDFRHAAVAQAGEGRRLVILTKGDLEGVSGSTNAMKILQVTDAG